MRVRLTLAYDGTDFHGFAPNPDVRTVGGTLGDALERVLGHEVELSCAGRTDTGVHAWGQVVSFDAVGDEVDVLALRRSLNRLCGPAIVVREVASAPDDFDARFSALWRSYRYTIVNRDTPDPFLARTAWHVERPLEPRAMRSACDPLIGEHDFSSFCRRPGPSRQDGAPPSLVRRVMDATWVTADGGLLRFDITASSFCHQMVRAIVGTMVEIGSGRRTAGDMVGILACRDRRHAGQMAPARGLCLWEVGYQSTPGQERC